jgi:DNA polymerase-3 subunit alpha
MAEFAGYGFNKSHSCAYALLAYQTAYLKVHYPVEFMAAMMTAETGNTEKVVKYINEARGMGITVLPPDVNQSDVDFTPVGPAIRFGMRAIKNVGENTVRGILDARAQLSRFTSLFQFCESVDPRLINKRVLESLIRAGALDSLGARRAQLFAVIDRAMERGQKLHRDRTSGQHGLFGGSGPVVEEPVAESLPDIEEWPEHELLAGEYATLGFYVSGHPLARYAGRLQELKVVELAAIGEELNGKEIAVCGLIQGVRMMRNRDGKPWAIVSLQDMSGFLELMVFWKAYEDYGPQLRKDAAVVVNGRVQVEDTGTRLMVSRVRSLESVADAGPRLMRVRVESAEFDAARIDDLERLFDRKPGRCTVAFEIVTADGSVATVQSERRVKADRELEEQVRAICGPESVTLDR